jgi:RNA polymerase sigma-70 factor, ECF subfamily
MISSMPLALLKNAAMTESPEREAALALMDEDEFRAFYERTARLLWSYLSRTTGDPSQADDILQEAYYRFYRAGMRHEGESHRRNSLFRIATNLVRDAARRSSRHEDVPLEDEPAGAALPGTYTQAPERQAALRTDLVRALQRLEPVQREMLWLAYAQGASHEEIAGILGLKTVSIRTLLLRARRKLAALLTGGGAAPTTETTETRR